MPAKVTAGVRLSSWQLEHLTEIAQRLREAEAKAKAHADETLKASSVTDPDTLAQVRTAIEFGAYQGLVTAYAKELGVLVESLTAPRPRRGRR